MYRWEYVFCRAEANGCHQRVSLHMDLGTQHWKCDQERTNTTRDNFPNLCGDVFVPRCRKNSSDSVKPLVSAEEKILAELFGAGVEAASVLDVIRMTAGFPDFEVGRVNSI